MKYYITLLLFVLSMSAQSQVDYCKSVHHSYDSTIARDNNSALVQGTSFELFIVRDYAVPDDTVNQLVVFGYTDIKGYAEVPLYINFTENISWEVPAKNILYKFDPQKNAFKYTAILDLTKSQFEILTLGHVRNLLFNRVSTVVPANLSLLLKQYAKCLKARKRTPRPDDE